MGIEFLPGNYLGTVIDFGTVTGGFSGIPGAPFDAVNYGIITTPSAINFIPGAIFSVAGGGSSLSAPAPPPVGDGGTGRDPKA